MKLNFFLNFRYGKFRTDDDNGAGQTFIINDIRLFLDTCKKIRGCIMRARSREVPKFITMRIFKIMVFYFWILNFFLQLPLHRNLNGPKNCLMNNKKKQISVLFVPPHGLGWIAVEYYFKNIKKTFAAIGNGSIYTRRPRCQSTMDIICKFRYSNFLSNTFWHLCSYVGIYKG